MRTGPATLFAAFAATAALVLSACQPKLPARPNVIFILVDTLRADHLGCYGSTGGMTPGIDHLAARSMRFTRASTVAPRTRPAIATLFTSLHPQNHCVNCDDKSFCGEESQGPEFEDSLAESATTLAEAFQGNGYQTAGYVGNFVLGPKWGWSQGFETYFSPEWNAHIHNGDEILGRGRKFLEGRDKSRPFFLYLHLMDPHATYQFLPEDFAAMQKLQASAPLTDKDRRRLDAAMVTSDFPDPAMAGDLGNWKAAYAAAVMGMDRRLGKFLGDIEKAGVLEDTFVVFAADHGEELNDHGFWGHGHSLHEELIRIPLMIRPPGSRRVRKTYDGPVSLIDVGPTVLRLAGLAPPPRFQGVDFSPVVLGKRQEKNNTWTFSTSVKSMPFLMAVRGERYKLILDPATGRRTLYDLKNDPGESHEISGDNPKLADGLAAVVKGHLNGLRKHRNLVPGKVDITKEDAEAIRSLGYLQ